MINLVIDSGNTLSKIALFDNRSLISVENVTELLPSYISEVTKKFKVDNAIFSSVNAKSKEVEEILTSQCNYFNFTAAAPSKIKNRYKTPHTLGLDRYAAVIGAEALCPDQNCLIIDAGTCITYDFVSADKEYAGGSISPGITMRFKAMNAFTGKLPLLEPDFLSAEEIGSDTATSMLTGVQKGIIYEALGFIGQYNSKWPDLNVLLCGGDVNFFDTQLKSSIFAHTLKTEPNLVLIGLNEVIYYNND